MKKYLIFIILFLMCGTAFAQPQIGFDKVREIKLLESNRDDVRRVLSSYQLEAQEKYHYDRFSTKGAEISVEYSEGNCREFRTDGFKVPEWKAIYIRIEPDNPIKLKALKINRSELRKEKMFYEVDDLYFYYNKESGIILTVEKDEIQTIEFIPPAKYYNLMCDQEKAEILSATSSIFENELKDRGRIISCQAPAGVSEFSLSQMEITGSCNTSDSKEAKTCLEDGTMIDISTITTSREPEFLTYRYTISVGKILGKGAKVQWDLSGVKPGTYLITAAVDDGCGFCGKTMTKQVVVKECRDCH